MATQNHGSKADGAKTARLPIICCQNAFGVMKPGGVLYLGGQILNCFDRMAPEERESKSKISFNYSNELTLLTRIFGM